MSRKRDSECFAPHGCRALSAGVFSQKQPRPEAIFRELAGQFNATGCFGNAHVTVTDQGDVIKLGGPGMYCVGPGPFCALPPEAPRRMDGATLTCRSVTTVVFRIAGATIWLGPSTERVWLQSGARPDSTPSPWAWWPQQRSHFLLCALEGRHHWTTIAKNALQLCGPVPCAVTFAERHLRR